MTSEAVSRAWRDAARDLGIEVEAPFVLEIEGANPVRFEALVRGFGGPKGALVAVDSRARVTATATGFFYSELVS